MDSETPVKKYASAGDIRMHSAYKAAIAPLSMTLS